MFVETRGLDDEAIVTECLSSATQVGLSRGEGACHEQGMYPERLAAFTQELHDRLEASLKLAEGRIPAFLAGMYPWGIPTKDLVEQFIASAVYLGEHDTGTASKEVHTYRKRLNILASAVRARLEGTFPPYSLRSIVRIRASSSGKVAPLQPTQRRAIPDASGTLTRQHREQVRYFYYHGQGSWSVTFFGREFRYPADQFEPVVEEKQKVRSVA